MRHEGDVTLPLLERPWSGREVSQSEMRRHGRPQPDLGRARSRAEIGYFEKLHNLQAPTATGFKVWCFPMEMRGGCAGLTGEVAIQAD
jgi:hypothetical protein